MFFDTLIEDMPDSMFLDRPWGKDNNSKTVVWQYLNEHGQFVIDADHRRIGWFSKVD
ncbi:CmcI family methyltransferase [Aeromonas enteropelogenes]|uniref:CmcI family methyltransferase n=1 Tax=Aeromonas enteropelogenes TaxID=29489 RepID=UPI00398A3EE4